MFNKKGIVLAAGALVALGTLAACNNGSSATDITVWCSTADQTVVQGLIDGFLAAHPDYVEQGYTIRISGNVSEAEAATNLNKDKANAADLMFAADDNIRMAVDGEAVLELSDDEIGVIEANDGTDAVEAVTVDGAVYGYPYRDDNTYMLFYDTRYVSDEQAKTVEGIFEACKASNVAFMWDLDSGWYSVSAPTAFLKGIWVDAETGYIDSDLYSTKGVQLYEYIMQLRKDYGTYWSFDSGNEVVQRGFGADVEVNTSAETAGSTLTTFGAALWWNDPLVLANEHVKVTKLPTININGQAGQMKPFKGFKAVILNSILSQTPEKEAVARELAAYMTNEDSQRTFMTEKGYGVSNDKVAAEIEGNPFLEAVALQGDATLPQGANVTNDFWTPIETWGKYISTGSWGDATDAEGALDALVNENTGWVKHADIIQNGTIGTAAE